MLLLVVNILAFLFEVMDKEPTLFDIWRLFLIIGVAGFLLCLWRSWMLLAALPVALFFALGTWAELHDPYVGPAIVAEAGQGYVTQCYAAMAVALVLPFVGALTGWVRKALRLISRPKFS